MFIFAPRPMRVSIANFEKTSEFQFSMLDFMTFGITPSQNIEENSSYRNN